MGEIIASFPKIQQRSPGDSRPISVRHPSGKHLPSQCLADVNRNQEPCKYVQSGCTCSALWNLPSIVGLHSVLSRHRCPFLSPSYTGIQDTTVSYQNPAHSPSTVSVWKVLLHKNSEHLEPHLTFAVSVRIYPPHSTTFKITQLSVCTPVHRNHAGARSCGGDTFSRDSKVWGKQRYTEGLWSAERRAVFSATILRIAGEWVLHLHKF